METKSHAQQIADQCPETILYNISNYIQKDPITLIFPNYRVTIDYTLPEESIHCDIGKKSIRDYIDDLIHDDFSYYKSLKIVDSRDNIIDITYDGESDDLVRHIHYRNPSCVLSISKITSDLIQE